MLKTLLSSVILGTLANTVEGDVLDDYFNGKMDEFHYACELDKTTVSVRTEDNALEFKDIDGDKDLDEMISYRPKKEVITDKARLEKEQKSLDIIAYRMVEDGMNLMKAAIDNEFAPFSALQIYGQTSFKFLWGSYTASTYAPDNYEEAEPKRELFSVSYNDRFNTLFIFRKNIVLSIQESSVKSLWLKQAFDKFKGLAREYQEKQEIRATEMRKYIGDEYDEIYKKHCER